MPREPLQRALAIAFLAFAATYGAYQSARALFHTKQGLDFTPEYIAARMLTDHGDLRFYDYDVVKDYGRRLGLHGPLGPDDPVVNYAYPPWLPMVYVPLSRLPWDLARRIWFALSLAGCFAAAGLVGSAVAPSEQDRRPYAIGAMTACAFYFPLTFSLMNGQANELPLLGICASLYFLVRGRPFLAGLVLAPAALWKIFTGFPALFLLARREWRALAGLALGCAAIVAASLPFVGLQTWIDWFHYIRGHNQLDIAMLRNHSILGSVILLFQENAVSAPLVHAPGLVRPVALALQGAAVALAGAALLSRARRDEPGYGVQFGATLILAVLLTPKAWEHYGIYLLPAFIACFAALGPRRARPALVPLALLGGAFAVWAMLFQMKDDYYALSTRARVVFIPVKMYAAMALLGLCAWCARAGRAEPAAAAPGAANADRPTRS